MLTPHLRPHQGSDSDRRPPPRCFILGPAATFGSQAIEGDEVVFCQLLAKAHEDDLPG